MKRILSLSFILVLLFPTSVNAFVMGTEPRDISYIRQQVLEISGNYIGTRYCRGGESPRCFDCSGFTQFVYSEAGVELPRMGSSQLENLNRVLPENAKPGDLVFFTTKSGYIYHAGIYIGNGLMIHSPKPGQRVKVAPVLNRAIYATIENQLDNKQ